MDIASSGQSIFSRTHDQDCLGHVVILYPLFMFTTAPTLRKGGASAVSDAFSSTNCNFHPQEKDKRLGKPNFSVDILRIQMLISFIKRSSKKHSE